jgi:MoaA/NifB/PqqE/SkfB family radical SAM enzyme
MNVKFEQLLNRARDENVLHSALLELTYGCNLNCTFCYNDLNLRGRRVSLDGYKTLLDDLSGMGVLDLTLSGGEPLMYQHFFELGACAKDKGFVIKVKSNAVPLNHRNAGRLKAEVDPYVVETSLHGARPESHDRLTQVPGSFDRLVKNIGILKKEGLRVKVNSTLTRWNENEIAEMFDLADRLDVPLQFDPEVTPKDDGDLSPLEISPSKQGIENMVRLSMQRSLAALNLDRLPITLRPESRPAQNPDRKKHKVCGAGSTNVIVDPFGNVYPCVQFRRKVGNIHDQSINEIWNGSAGLKEVRDLAERALDVALGSGLKQFCMGVNELQTGDPLQSPQSKLEIDQVYQRIHWEIQTEDQDAA